LWRPQHAAQSWVASPAVEKAAAAVAVMAPPPRLLLPVLHTGQRQMYTVAPMTQRLWLHLLPSRRSLWWLLLRSKLRLAVTLGSMPRVSAAQLAWWSRSGLAGPPICRCGTSDGVTRCSAWWCHELLPSCYILCTHTPLTPVACCVLHRALYTGPRRALWCWCARCWCCCIRRLRVKSTHYSGRRAPLCCARSLATDCLALPVLP
jgi:hypothetical protein